MKVKIKCDWCGKEFLRNKGDLKKHNYCSKACLGKANGERQRKVNLKECSNCGKTFDYRGSHGKRNKNFFCSYECYLEFKSKKKEVTCDWCGKNFLKKSSDINRTSHNFCSHDCELAYRHKAGENSWNHRVDGKIIHRKIAEDKLGRPLRSDEEVHHIDGNHFNNDPDNIMVLPTSLHSKIHASWKRRNARGQFVKA